MKKVLILEPYFGGSHKSFLKGLQKSVKAEYTFFTLPARKWKMRMQLSAQWFVKSLEALPKEERWFDTVLSSTFVDLSVFKALVSKLEGWNQDVKICLYFHENQFVYPNQVDDKAVYQFTAINFNSALVADSLAFNSDFNRVSLLDGCRKYLKAASDMKLMGLSEKIEGKSRVLYPGIDFHTIDNEKKAGRISNYPVIIWNHRWEHDKNPDEFFRALCTLSSNGLQFKLIVLGESFRHSPDCFEMARKQLKDHLLHFGYVESYQEYCRWLSKGTVAVSTSNHEFYGISVLEAVRAGCTPLLPKRLSYPELFPEKYLYAEGDFLSQLERAVKENKKMDPLEARELTEKMDWEKLSPEYSDWLFGLN